MENLFNLVDQFCLEYCFEKDFEIEFGPSSKTARIE